MKIDLEDENLKGSLLGLVMALLEIIHKILEHQALRRVENESLSDDEVERLGNALLKLSETIEQIKKEQGIVEAVSNVHKQLNSLVDGSLFSIN
ncbi:MAG: gas vesicle protein K [Chlamydiota bacterium]